MELRSLTPVFGRHEKVATMMAGPTFAIGVVLAVVGAARIASPESQSKPIGCYRLSYGAWVPAIDPAALADSLPPGDIELVLRRGLEVPKHVIAERRGERPIGKPPWADWQSDTGDDITLRWSTGLAGVVLFLRRDSEGVFRGKAKHLFDDSGTHEADVAATRVECPAVGDQKPPAH
jgi:hypothetical protein